MRYVPAVIVDVVLVLVFAVIGRASHDENPAGFLLTAWPFLVALVVGHAIAAVLPRRPRQPWSLLWGVVVWLVTVVGGLLLRVVSGDTAQLPFIIVATLTLGVFLLGWRALTGFLRARRARAHDSETHNSETHDSEAHDSETHDSEARDDDVPDETAPAPADTTSDDVPTER